METLVNEPKEVAGEEARGRKPETKVTNSAATEDGPETDMRSPESSKDNSIGSSWLLGMQVALEGNTSFARWLVIGRSSRASPITRRRGREWE